MRSLSENSRSRKPWTSLRVAGPPIVINRIPVFGLILEIFFKVTTTDIPLKKHYRTFLKLRFRHMCNLLQMNFQDRINMLSTYGFNL